MAVLRTTDIDVILLRNTLAYDSTDVGTLCSCPNINMFSKYKPVRLATTDTTGNSTWWRSNNGKCGIDIPYLDNLAMIDTTNWLYEAPRGGGK